MSAWDQPANRSAADAATAKAPPPGRRWIKWVIGAAVVAGLMYACRGERTWHWEEEVVAGAGERLRLERSVRLERISAPFNPFKSEWAWRESTIVVRDGPADVKGARFEARLLPMLIERDPSTKQWVVVGIPVSCSVYQSFKPDVGLLYLAFEPRAEQDMRQVPIPDWAWERRLNLLMPNENKPPPRRVTPDFADRFNREESRGELVYFQIRRETPVNCR